MFSDEQYRAAHTSAVMIDRTASGTIALFGGDRASFLHALVTNDIAKVTRGTGAYAAYLTPQGRMISDMRIVELGDRLLLSVEPGIAPGLARRLDSLIFSEDVQIRNISEDVDVIAVRGPSAMAMIQRAIGITAADLHAEYDNVTVDSVTIVRDDGLGVQGFDVFAPRNEADALRARLVEAGVVRASIETAETLRIEAGRPRFGVDMDTDTIPLEAGIEDRAISFTKGCYVGQEVIIRVMHRGHGRVARRLVSLVVAAGAVPSRGDAIVAGDRQVGEVTSATASPKHGSPLALGYVQRDHAAPGTELTVGGSQARVYQTVN